jgi:hypothetical protein
LTDAEEWRVDRLDPRPPRFTGVELRRKKKRSK